MPALRPTARSPQFSKSAPNLDKSRIASNSTSTSHSEIIGKSVEGLTTTSLSKISLDDDDDDDEVEVKGCFGFIRSDVSYSKQKKYSLDSKLSENIMILNDDDRLQSPDTDATDSMSSGEKKCNLDDVQYDRVFYRVIQKSLDDIFSRDDFNQQFVAQNNARNSKSSGDLTLLNEGDEEAYSTYRFQRHGSISKFDRECFFTNKAASFEASENEVSFASVSSTQDSRRRPLDSSLEDSFNALNMTYDSPTKYDERKNSMCSDQSSVDLSTASRKSSVTFRQIVDSIESDSEHFANSYRPDLNQIESIFVPTTRLPQSTADKFSSKERSKLKSALTNKDRPRTQKYKGGLSRLFKFNKNKAVVRTNSLYNKFDNSCELNEKLLDDSSNVASNEPQYDAIFRTKNFVLAKQNENQ